MKTLICALLTLTLSSPAWPQSSTLSMPTNNAQGESQLKITPDQKIEDDHQITDIKLKAEQGSLSKYSLKVILSYSGPPIGDLSNKRQPNPDGSIGNASTSLGGTIGGRYRFDKETALSLSTGISALTPLHGVERVDIRTPTLTYEQVFRVDEWQFKNAPGVSAVTVPEYIQVGEFASLNYDASAYRNLGLSRFKIGTEVSFGYYLYNRSYLAQDRTAVRYNLSFYPAVKYAATDKLGFYTSLNISFWNLRTMSNESTMWNKTLSQRFGLEYALTKDIYVAPYLNFYPKSLAVDSTTINVSTIFSLL